MAVQTRSTRALTLLFVSLSIILQQTYCSTNYSQPRPNSTAQAADSTARKKATARLLMVVQSPAGLYCTHPKEYKYIVDYEQYKSWTLRDLYASSPTSKAAWSSPCPQSKKLPQIKQDVDIDVDSLWKIWPTLSEDPSKSESDFELWNHWWSEGYCVRTYERYQERCSSHTKDAQCFFEQVKALYQLKIKTENDVPTFIDTSLKHLFKYSSGIPEPRSLTPEDVETSFRGVNVYLGCQKYGNSCAITRVGLCFQCRVAAKSNAAQSKYNWCTPLDHTDPRPPGSLQDCTHNFVAEKSLPWGETDENIPSDFSCYDSTNCAQVYYLPQGCTQNCLDLDP